MKTLITVTLNKPAPCGASLAAALNAVADLSGSELAELAQHLRRKYPDKFGP